MVGEWKSSVSQRMVSLCLMVQLDYMQYLRFKWNEALISLLKIVFLDHYIYGS